jgi:membrane protein DedA with SNARE-associated domain
MPQPLFLAWTTAGSLIWIVFLTLAGQALGAGYEQIGHVLKPFGDLFAGLLGGAVLLGVLALLLRWRRRGNPSRPEE